MYIYIKKIYSLLSYNIIIRIIIIKIIDWNMIFIISFFFKLQTFLSILLEDLILFFGILPFQMYITLFFPQIFVYPHFLMKNPLFILFGFLNQKFILIFQLQILAKFLCFLVFIFSFFMVLFKLDLL